MTFRAVALVVLAVLAVGVAVATFVRCEGAAPVISGPEETVVGRRGGSLRLGVVDEGSGLRELRVVIAHAQGEASLLERSFPGQALTGGSEHEAQVELELDPKALGIPEGGAFLRASARDWSWAGSLQGNQGELEIPLSVDLTPPRIRVESGLTYVRRGGSAAVVYALREATARDGVQVGDVFFPGAPLPGAGRAETPRRRLGIFAVPRDAAAEPAIRVVGADRAGNRRVLPWPTRLQERSFPEVPIKLSPGFLENKVRQLAEELGVEAADPVAAFHQINTKVRAENEARIRKAVAKSSPEKLWEGAFLQLPNSRVTSRFAEQRTYEVEGREVSQAIHYGYDLASVAHAPILAANRGRVIFAEDLGIYGQTVLLDHGGGLTSLYGHLSEIAVEVGDLVEKSQELGRSGETGLAGGDHLHFAILVGGVYVDPLEWWDGKWVQEHVEVRIAAP